MKVYIMVDFEGIAGMIEWDSYYSDTPMEHEKRHRMRTFLTGEVNAAVEGCLAAGADDVLIWDAHGPSNNCNNIYFEDLHPDCEIIIGYKGLPSFYPLLDDGFDAGMYVGGHAMEGTTSAILPHTVTVLNGKRYGEVGMFSVLCGWHGVPMIFVSGDKATIEETKDNIPNIEYVITKEAFGPYAAKTKIPKKAQQLIRVGTEQALKRMSEIKPLRLDPPYVMELGGGRRIEGDNLKEVWDKRFEGGNRIGCQDPEPERSRAGQKRKKWQEFDSFLVP